MQIFPYEGVCVACPAISETSGDHAVSCGWGGEGTYRHDAIRDCLFSTCVQACLGPTREGRALIPGRQARPADIYLPSWSGGLDTALDITVINLLQQTLLDRSAANPGHALQVAFNRKMSKQDGLQDGWYCLHATATGHTWSLGGEHIKRDEENEKLFGQTHRG